jgi:hypothetical protein
VSKDFKEFIRISGMTHVRASPYYPSYGAAEDYLAAQIARIVKAQRSAVHIVSA